MEIYDYIRSRFSISTDGLYLEKSPATSKVKLNNEDNKFGFLNLAAVGDGPNRWALIVPADKGHKETGYRVISIGEGFQEQLHRVVYMVVHGPIPEGMLVDHKDRNPRNCIPSNLRLATIGENAQNTKTRSDNKLGHKGISKCKTTGMYRAEISTKATGTIRLGRFRNLEDAIAARAAKEKELFTHSPLNL